MSKMPISVSLNHLYSGQRVWDVILEEQLRLANPTKDYDQLTRHQAIFIPKHMCDTWNILNI